MPSGWAGPGDGGAVEVDGVHDALPGHYSLLELRGRRGRGAHGAGCGAFAAAPVRAQPHLPARGAVPRVGGLRSGVL